MEEAEKEDKEKIKLKADSITVKPITELGPSGEIVTNIDYNMAIIGAEGK